MRYSLAVGLVLAAGLSACAGPRAAQEAAACLPAAAAARVAPAAGEAAVSALPHSGRPWRAYRLRVPMPGARAVCAAGVRLRVPVRNPATGAADTRVVPLTDVRLEGGALLAVAAGPVARGSHLRLAPGALRFDEGYSAATTLPVPGPLPPRAATLWFKAYVPTRRAWLPPQFSERRSSMPRRGQVSSLPAAYRGFATDAELVAALRRVYDRFVDAGRLAPARARHYLSLVRDPAARAVFTGPDGRFHRYLMAAVLANAGTVGEPAIAALIGGDNVTGRPARMFFDIFVKAHMAEAAVEDGRLVIRVNPHRALVEPFALLAPVLGAHEAFHQDNRIGRHEEVIAAYAGFVAAAQQYLANPWLARTNTRLARVLNARLLLMLNSGAGAFPRPGLLAAPLRQSRQDAIPGAAAAPWPSLAGFVRHLYADVADRPTPGNPYADRVLSLILDRPVNGAAFDPELIRRLDAHSRVPGPRQQFELMRILALAPAP